MSLFGKVLALFNIFGAIALVALAFMDYSKRQVWSYNVLRTDLIVRGLPLDEQEADPEGRSLADRIGADTQEKMFAQAGGNPVWTQLHEVRRVQRLFDERVEAAVNDPIRQTFVLARILLPLTDSIVERDELLACRYWFETPAGAAQLEKRYADAFRQALSQPLRGEEKSFENAFRLALRAQLGQPSDAFATRVVSFLPATPGKGTNFSDAYKKAVVGQRADLQARYRAQFDRALQGKDAGKEMGIEAHKSAIARLLFGVAVVQAEEAEPRQPGADWAAFGQRVAVSPQFRSQLQRFYIVCGLKHGLGAISERSAVLRSMADSLTGVMSQERMQFVADHAALLETVREASYLVYLELAKKAESERKLTVEEELVKKRERDVKALTEELGESRAQTADRLKELRELSQKLLDDRVQNRDLIRKTEEAEREIRELERQIRERESASR
jgi:hypothetical protein